MSDSHTVSLSREIISKYCPGLGSEDIKDTPHSLFFRLAPEVSQQVYFFLTSRGWIDLSYAHLHPSDYPRMIPSHILSFLNTGLRQLPPAQRVLLMNALKKQISKEIDSFLESHRDPITGKKPRLDYKKSPLYTRIIAYYKCVPPIWNLWWEDAGFNPIVSPILSPRCSFNHIFSTTTIFRKDGLNNTLLSLRKHYGDLFNIVPFGWVLPTQLDEWQEYIIKLYASIHHLSVPELMEDIDPETGYPTQMNLDEEITPQHAWIAKPSGGHRGEGIFVFNKLNDLVQKLHDMKTTKRGRGQITLHVKPSTTTITKDDGNSNLIGSSTTAITASPPELSSSTSSHDNINTTPDPSQRTQAPAAAAAPSPAPPSTDKDKAKATIPTVITALGYTSSNQPQSLRLGSSTYTVQEYIHNPMLIGSPRHKFDLRLYVLVESFYPLRVYIHKKGLVRFASQPYDDDISNNLAHLTNYSLNKSKKKKSSDTTSVKSRDVDVDTNMNESNDLGNNDNNLAAHSMHDIDPAEAEPEEAHQNPYRALHVDRNNPITGDSGCKWTLDDFFHYIDQRKEECDARGLAMYNRDEIWLLIKHLLIKAILPSVAHYVPLQPLKSKDGYHLQDTPSDTSPNHHTDHTIHQNGNGERLETVLGRVNPSYRGFELLGVDVMLKDDGTPVLIEMNRSPAMAVTTSADHVKTQILHDIFNMLRIEPSLLAAKRYTAQYNQEKSKHAEQQQQQHRNNDQDSEMAMKDDDNTGNTDDIHETQSLLSSLFPQATATAITLPNTDVHTMSNSSSKGDMMTTSSISPHPTSSSQLTPDNTMKTNSQEASTSTTSLSSSTPNHLVIDGVSVPLELPITTTMSWILYRPDLKHIMHLLSRQLPLKAKTTAGVSLSPVTANDSDKEAPASIAEYLQLFHQTFNTYILSQLRKKVTSKLQTKKDVGERDFSVGTVTEIDVDSPKDQQQSSSSSSLIDAKQCNYHQFELIFPLQISNYVNYNAIRQVYIDILEKDMQTFIESNGAEVLTSYDDEQLSHTSPTAVAMIYSRPAFGPYIHHRAEHIWVNTNRIIDHYFLSDIPSQKTPLVSRSISSPPLHKLPSNAVTSNITFLFGKQPLDQHEMFHKLQDLCILIRKYNEIIHYWSTPKSTQDHPQDYVFDQEFDFFNFVRIHATQSTRNKFCINQYLLASVDFFREFNTLVEQ